ncbi:MAG: undecaprenyl-diphosphate phosphatase [Thermoplasmata archaeon]
MDLFDALILGIIQGLTEWLPISSSGHLALVQYLLSKDVPFAFDMMLHLATLLVLIGFFRMEIKDVILQFFGILKDISKKVPFKEAVNSPKRRLCVCIIIGTIPTGIIGLLIDFLVEYIYSSLLIVGIMFFTTAVILYSTRKVIAKRKVEDMNFKDALIIGTVQGFAAMPGLSRSGSTIGAGILLGIEQETSGKYSFLLSIPSIIAGTLLHVEDIAVLSYAEILPFVLGFVIASIVGYLSLFMLMKVLKSNRIHIFSPYCILLGIFALSIFALGW